MKKTIIALSLAALALPALAQDKKGPEPDFTMTPNIGVVSDYRFRGVSQNDKKPALQGGLDFVMKNGFYLGAWASRVSEWANTGGNNMEVDLYGGYKGSLPNEIDFDIGFITYQYPNTTGRQQTRELYLGLSKGPLSYKLYRTLSKGWFGIDPIEGDNDESAKGSLYHDLTISFPLNDKISLSAHAGVQKIKSRDEDVDPSFKDYRVGLTYDLGDGLSAGIALTSVDLKENGAKAWFTGTTGKALYGTGKVFSLTKTF